MAIEHDGVSSLIDAMTAHPSSGELIAWACGALANLAHFGGPPVKGDIVDADGLEVMIDAIRTYPKDKEVQFRARKAIKTVL